MVHHKALHHVLHGGLGSFGPHALFIFQIHVYVSARFTAGYGFDPTFAHNLKNCGHGCAPEDHEAAAPAAVGGFEAAAPAAVGGFEAAAPAAGVMSGASSGADSDRMHTSTSLLGNVA